MKIKSAVQSIALTLALLVSLSVAANAQRNSDEKGAAPASDTTSTAAKTDTKTDAKTDTTNAPKPASVEDRLRALEQLVEDQQREIQSLHSVIDKSNAASAQPAAAAQPASATTAQPTVASNQTPPSGTPDQSQKRVDDLFKKFGALRLSGDLRFRVETFRNQGFDALAEAPDRNRLRVRARLELDGILDKHFDWGVRVATGVFTDPITTNQTLGDFYERKAISLDRAFVRYDSKGDNVGVQLIAGKFEPTFRRTQLVWDDDINVEGASEALYFKTKSVLRQVKFVGFELPFNEVSGGKDGVLYGGQAQTDWQFSPRVTANFNVGYYDWNHADQIIGALGAATTQVNGGIQNGAPISGNQNGALGTTNRLVRNAAGVPVGFLAGFNLVDFLGNVSFQATKRFPVTFTFDYVHNASNRIDDENNGYWVGANVGQLREKGDWLFGYFYTRIEQDAVLVPFNFSDILASNSRAHMPTVGYQLANNVTLQWTGLFSQRVNKVVLTSPFDRYLNRMQFDVIYKF